MEKRLTEIFNQTVNEIKISDPLKLEKFILVFKDDIIYKTDDQRAVKNYEYHKDTIKKNVLENSLGELINVTRPNSDDTVFNLLYIPSAHIGQRPHLSNIIKDYDYMFNVSVFDHEMGHLLVGKEEAKAESYAALMHVKRFGNKTGFLEQAAFEIAECVTCQTVPEISQFSSNCWFAVEALSKEIDISKLSLKEIIDYAELIPEKFEFSAEKLETISNIYQNCLDDENSLIINNVINKMHKHIDDDDVYRVGKTILSQPHIKGELKIKFEFLDSADKSRGFILNPIEALDKETGTSSIKELVAEKNSDTPKILTKKLARYNLGIPIR